MTSRWLSWLRTSSVQRADGNKSGEVVVGNETRPGGGGKREMVTNDVHRRLCELSVDARNVKVVHNARQYTLADSPLPRGARRALLQFVIAELRGAVKDDEADRATESQLAMSTGNEPNARNT